MWTPLDAATALDHHMRRLPQRAPTAGRFTAVVVGAGFTGLEVATELTARLREVAGDAGDVRVVLVERADAVGPELGEGPRPQISSALSDLGVEVYLGKSVERVTENEVHLSDGEIIAASTVIWTAGVAASPLTQYIPGERDRHGRLRVDEFLRVIGAPEVFATGDTAAAAADAEHTVMQSCQHAIPLGKFAGHNVAADVLGLDPAAYVPNPYVTCLDLGPSGAVVTLGWDRVVQKTGEKGKALKRQINAVWIYPPVDDAEAILKLANHEDTWSMEEVLA
ncbi:NAD(P)/FAD-dependent oxidoreductase [Streptomyces sp. NPDC001070]